MSCGKVLGGLWETFERRVQEGEEARKVLDELGLTRYCCRAAFVGNYNILQEIGKFKR
jgi:DNA-directed RNA polymerase subunit N